MRVSLDSPKSLRSSVFLFKHDFSEGACRNSALTGNAEFFFKISVDSGNYFQFYKASLPFKRNYNIIISYFQDEFFQKNYILEVKNIAF